MSKNFQAKVNIIFASILILSIIAGFIVFYVQSNNLTLFDRLSNLSEDGGSGRDIVYQYTWEMILNSDFNDLLFGHGFNTVYHNSVLNLSAHTDTLEVIYDYGIIGIILYCIFIINIFRLYKTIRKYKPEYAAAYAASLVIFTILSLFSHLIIYPSHFLFLCAFWGLSISVCNKYKQTCLKRYLS